MKMLVRVGLLTLAAFSIVLAQNGAAAQKYPSKSIRLIVPFPPGGGADIIARGIGQKVSENLGQQILIDNRTGASGLIGADVAAKATPDGYTMVLGTSSNFSINPGLVRKPPYDPVRDFMPVTLIATAPLLLAVHPSLPVKSVKDLIGLANSRPRELLYASNGAGSLSHLATELFSGMARVRMIHVPYKGGTPAVIDTVSGQVQLIITAVPTLMAQVKAARLRALGVTGSARSEILPELPTISEAALKGFEAIQWYGLLVPRGTPNDVIEKMYQETARVVRTRETADLLARDGSVGVGNHPAEFGAFLRADVAKWAKVIRDKGIKLD